jgi:hypothetical protein
VQALLFQEVSLHTSLIALDAAIAKKHSPWSRSCDV